jgi:hypothetical protein
VQDEFPRWQNVMQMSRHIERTSAKGDTITKQHDRLHKQRTENRVLTSNPFGALSEMLTDNNSSSDNEADNIGEYSQSIRVITTKDKHFDLTVSLRVTPMCGDSVPFTNEDTAVNLTINNNS